MTPEEERFFRRVVEDAGELAFSRFITLARNQVSGPDKAIFFYQSAMILRMKMIDQGYADPALPNTTFEN